MRVKINRYNPVLIDIKVFIFGQMFHASICDFTKQFFTVSDDTGITFQTHAEALNYCENQEYEVENNV
jgi:hypothetical protein